MSFLSIFGIDQMTLDKKNKELSQLNLNKSNALYVFPFTLQNGFVDLTEAGENEHGSVVEDSSYFERIWTGDDNGIAVWDGSTSTESKNGKLYKKYEVGNHFFGLAYESDITSKVGASAFQADFTAQTQDENIDMFIPSTQYKITKQDMLKVFIIPQLSQRWLRITSTKIGRGTDQEELGYWISFETMDTALGKTGSSVFQTIQRAAPGEGYAWPRLDADKEIELDPARLRDIGVDEVQIELLGNMMICGMGMFGRAVNTFGLDPNEVDQPHWIFGQEIQRNQPTKISRTSIPTADLTPVINAKPTFISYFKNWKDDMKSNYDWSTRKKYEGIFDSTWSASDGNDFNKKSTYDPSNRVSLSTTNRVYIQGSNSPYGGFDYEIAEAIDMPSLLAHNIVNNMWIPQLPMQIEEAVAWKDNDLPIFGKLLGLLNIGNAGWTNTKFDNKMEEGFSGFMSRMQYKYGAEAAMDIGSNNKGWIPFEFLDNEKGSPVGDISATKSTNITLKFKLSDYIDYYDRPSSSMKNKATYGLGHDMIWDEHARVAFSDRQFAIDKFMAQIIGKGDYIVTFFNKGHAIHSSKHQTNGKFLDNTRAWMNVTTFSPWAAYDVDKYPTTWKLLKPPVTKTFWPPVVFRGANAGGEFTIPRWKYENYDHVAVGHDGHVVKWWNDTDDALPMLNGKYKMTAEYTAGIWSGYVFYDLTIDDHYASISISVSGDLYHIAPANIVTPPVISLITK